MIAFLLRLLGLCRHGAMYLEHRELAGRRVMHYVCDCGHAEPVLQRSAEEYTHLEQYARPAGTRRV